MLPSPKTGTYRVERLSSLNFKKRLKIKGKVTHWFTFLLVSYGATSKNTSEKSGWVAHAFDPSTQGAQANAFL